jgi:hypothetical protein
MGKKGVVVTAGVLAVITVMAGVAAAVFMGLVRTHASLLEIRDPCCDILGKGVLPLRGTPCVFI